MPHKKNTYQNFKVEPVIITTHSADKLTELILSDKKNFLLTEKVEDMLALMRLTRNLYCEFGSRSKVVSELVENHSVKEYKAWKLVDLTPRLFSTVYRETSREFHVDIHLEKIEETRELAKKAEDFKTMAICDSNRAHAIEKFLGSAQQLKPEDLILPDVEIGFHPELFEDIPDIKSIEYKNIIKAFQKRKEVQRKLSIVDIDYEETFD